MSDTVASISIEEAVRNSKSIAMDTNCVAYYLEDVRPWSSILEPVFEAALAGALELYVSTVVVSELLSFAHFESRARVGYDPELSLLATLQRHFEMVDVTERVARVAGRLRGTHLPGGKMSLKTPDCLIGATSLSDRHDVFLTNDEQLFHALSGINTIFLKDVALNWIADHFPSKVIESGASLTPGALKTALPAGVSAGSGLGLGAIMPESNIDWQDVLFTSFQVAGALNEPCAMCVLAASSAPDASIEEILFWHEGIERERPYRRIVRRVQEHLGMQAAAAYGPTTDEQPNGKCAYIFVHSSRAREELRQKEAEFLSKSEYQRNVDAWKKYLGPLRAFGALVGISPVRVFLCEGGEARQLKAAAGSDFVAIANNVFGPVGK